jgi:beta-glucosidase
MGREFYNSGVNVALTPVTGGPLGANPSGGRNWEGWYADPYATGVASYLSVVGMQEAGVIATSK